MLIYSRHNENYLWVLCGNNIIKLYSTSSAGFYYPEEQHLAELNNIATMKSENISLLIFLLCFLQVQKRWNCCPMELRSKEQSHVWSERLIYYFRHKLFF